MHTFIKKIHVFKQGFIIITKYYDQKKFFIDLVMYVPSFQ